MGNGQIKLKKMIADRGWSPRDKRRVESSVERDVVDHICKALLLGMLKSRSDVFGWKWYFVLLLNGFVGLFSSYVERGVQCVIGWIGRILEIKKRSLDMVPVILRSAIVFVVSTASLYPLVIWSKAHGTENAIRISIAMGLGSMLYSRCICRIIGRRPSVGRMIVAGVFMVLMGVSMFRMLYDRRLVKYKTPSGHYEAGRVSWDDERKEYDINYENEDESMFLRVATYVITPVFDGAGIAEEGKEVKHVYVVDIQRGEVEVDFIHNSIFISMH